MLDDRFDDQLRESAKDYNEPPETPREEMWAAIRAERASGKADRRTGGQADEPQSPSIGLSDRPTARPSIRRFRIPAAIAALLAIGIGLGRLSAPHTSPNAAPVVSTRAAPRPAGVAYQVATAEHLGQAETFLTLFRSSIRQGGNERLASTTARQLLATNRLLLDSPAASDNRTRVLLQDLELVLAQIAQLSPQPSSPDLDLITEDLEDSGVMSRLRTAVPSGTSITQGVL
ncbi:MAG TPA: hypothetical protein VFY42_00555 [Gemmatimonadales bacterium]|nr:hypothetical protein [Gemmatimonadales bacterium]